MATISIKPTYPFFEDEGGKALEQGYVYIGLANLNPETNPKLVYFDFGLSVTAAQPLRTISGRIDRNGSPARLFIDGDYSMTVKDKNGNIVYSALSHQETLALDLPIVNVDDMNAMLALTGSTDSVVRVYSYHAPVYSTVSPFDGGGGDFVWDTTMTKANADGALVFDPSVALDDQGTGVGLGAWARIYESSLTIESFGAVGDGVTDDTPYLIKAKDSVVKHIIFADKTYLCSTEIATATPVIDGMHWEGVGRGPTTKGTEIKYTGANYFAHFLQPNANTDAGGMLFENIRFNITDVDGGGFQFNDPAVPPLDAQPNPEYIRDIVFRNCMFTGYGSGITTAVPTKNAIDCTKVFELLVDEQCEIRGFLRGVSLFGCDNCTIKGRIWANGRNVHVERSTPFGNDTLIETRFLGATLISAPIEPSYNLYDDGQRTTSIGIQLEQTTAANDGLAFFSGRDCTHIGLHFNSNKAGQKAFVFNAAKCRDVKLIAPAMASQLDSPATTAVPAVYDTLPSLGEHKGVIIISPSSQVLSKIEKVPYIRVERDAAPSRIVADGLMPHYQVINHENIKPRVFGAGYSTNHGLVVDPVTGYVVMQIDGLITEGFEHVVGVVGGDLPPSFYMRVSAFAKMQALGNIRIIVKIGGANIYNTQLDTTLGTYKKKNSSVLLINTAGLLTIGIYNSNGNGLAYVDSIALAMSDEAGVTSTTGLSLALLEAELNTVKIALRNSGGLV